MKIACRGYLKKQILAQQAPLEKQVFKCNSRSVMHEFML